MITAPPAPEPLSASVTVSMTEAQKVSLRAESVRTGIPMSRIVLERYLTRTANMRRRGIG